MRAPAASLLCCFGGQAETSPDPFAGIAAEQERSRKSLRLLSRDLRYLPSTSPPGAMPLSPSSLARAPDGEELQRALAERLHSRGSVRSQRSTRSAVSALSARTTSDTQTHISAGTMSLRSSMRSSVRANLLPGDGPEWVDSAWDSLVKGRAIGDVTAPSLDDDELSFRSLAVAMQSQVVGAPELEDMYDGPVSGGSWASTRSAGSARSDSSGGSMRLQLLAEDPFMEDLSLDNLSLHSHTSRSHDERYYSPPTTRMQTATSFLDDAPSPPYSVDLNKESPRYHRSRKAIARGSPAGVPLSPGNSEKSFKLDDDEEEPIPAKLRLGEILGRVEGLARSASVSSAESGARFAADEAWPHPPLGAPLDDGIVDSSSGSEDGNMYSDAPSDAGPVGPMSAPAPKPADSPVTDAEVVIEPKPVPQPVQQPTFAEAAEKYSSSESESDSDSEEEEEAESSRSSSSSSAATSATQLTRSTKQRDTSPARAKAISRHGSVAESATSSLVSRPPGDRPETEFSYVTDQRSSSRRSVDQMSFKTACGRDCFLGFARCPMHAAADRPVKGDLRAKVAKATRAEKKRSLVAEAKMALARAADVKMTVVPRNASLPAEACKTKLPEEDCANVANLRRLWSERARA